MSQIPHDGLGRAVELIQNKAADAVKQSDRVAVLPLADDTAGRFFLIQNGQAELTLPPPALITGHLMSVDQAAYCAAIYSAELITVDEGLVKVVLDRADDRQAFRCPLTYSSQFDALSGLAERSFSQREFLELLRITLSGALDDAGSRLIAFVRKFQVDRNETTQVELKRDRESLGRSVQAEVRAEAGEMPERITVSVRVFRDRALQRRVQIPCLVDFSAATHEFRLVPEPDALEDAVTDTVQQIGDVIVAGISRLCGPGDDVCDHPKPAPHVLFGRF